ncbi:MAG: energy-coupling factor transporter transmembrane protein EcfT [Lachnospiraceae bacterium]|nr:energy-coupling factor transporter transmembrane protein EcfT [Lachnospiraceae bacterium]
MLRDITLGQYYRADSVIHRLDPRVKIAGTLAYMISLFVFNNLICYALAIVFLGTIIGLSKVPVKFMLRGMQSVVFLLIITVIYNVFLSSGTTIVKFWVFTITYEGIINAVFMFFRLMLLIMGSSVMTLTTTPNQLTDGLESLMRPLKIFKVPVHEMAMMMSIALRFIPILMEETDKIMKAQIARGADMENKNLFIRVKNLIPILVPLFISAFRRAGDLALAMEARCYHGGEGRTRMRVMKLAVRDAVAIVFLTFYLGTVIFSGIYFKDLTEMLVYLLQKWWT